MNNTKISNPVRLIAFFLTAIILICSFGFTVDGWQNEKINSDNLDSELPQNTDQEITDLPTDIPSDEQIRIPAFTNRLTGLETDEGYADKTPIGLITEDDLFYGLSRADILLEFPTEYGKIRRLSLITDYNNLWKIGPFASARKYVTNICKFFGAISVYGGEDDSIDYKGCDVSSSSFDLLLNESYSYTEHSSNIYSNFQLLSKGLSDRNIQINFADDYTPYDFPEFGADSIRSENFAASFSFNNEANSLIDLEFEEESCQYIYKKDGTSVIDQLTGSELKFTNCFILFADSTVYDREDYSQMVLDTIGDGKGYYLTEGSFFEIRWVATESGVLTFYNTDGEKLTINRGNIYISYLRSSAINRVSFT